MPNVLSAFVAQLNKHGSLDAHDTAAIFALPIKVQTVSREAYVLREGDRESPLLVLVEGFATREKQKRDGARQLVSLDITGDPLNLPCLFLSSADHAVVALRNATIAIIPSHAVRDLIAARPAIMQAFFKSALVDASIAREGLLRQGRLDARAGVAHFICEYVARMEARGLARGDVFDFPLTQEQLGNALGLTAIHVNRTYNRLSEERIVIHKARRFEIIDRDALRAAGEFRDEYLFL